MTIHHWWLIVSIGHQFVICLSAVTSLIRSAMQYLVQSSDWWLIGFLSVHAWPFIPIRPSGSDLVIKCINHDELSERLCVDYRPSLPPRHASFCLSISPCQLILHASFFIKKVPGQLPGMHLKSHLFRHNFLATFDRQRSYNQVMFD